jgi:hypothetical protein
MKENKTRKINNETLTKCICHKGFSWYSSIVARSNFRVGGQETATQSLTAHTLDRYVASGLVYLDSDLSKKFVSLRIITKDHGSESDTR